MGEFENGYAYVWADGVGVCRVDSDDNDVSVEVALATATLIAIAPDLLKECENALGVLRSAIRAGLDGFSEQETSDIVEEHETIKRLKNVIAKADPR